ncbi:MAG TPA: NADH-quinone oxidoreductase subunit J [Planctomycetaceae bacterium]|nr:NADH-quinone oxidoreductase subunit J [Planctomycetaceae bacterium]
MINWHSFFFLLMASISAVAAVAVVLSANVVRMAFYLIISLGGVAGLFFLAGADFVGTMQLVIYVGGTLVLLVFGVMLTARGPFVTMRTSGGHWVLAVAVGGALLVVLLQAAVRVGVWQEGRRVEPSLTAKAEKTATPLGLGLLGVRVDKLDEQRAVLRQGMSGYLLPFEIISVHLLVVLVGAAYLARAKRRRREAAGGGEQRDGGS